MASQLLGDVWRLVDQAYDTTALRPLMASVARSAGLTPAPRASLEAQEAPLALRSAAVASGSQQVFLGQRLLRPSRVPLTGLLELPPGGASSVRSRAPHEAIRQLCEGLGVMAPQELRAAALYGATFLAERLGAQQVQELLRGPLLELVLGEAKHTEREGRKQIHGNAARAEEIKEVRRSWNAEMEAGNAWRKSSCSRFGFVFMAFDDLNSIAKGREASRFGRQMQWFDLLRGAGTFLSATRVAVEADSEDEDSEGSALA